MRPHLEPFMSVLAQDAGSKRAERLPELDLQVHDRLHFWGSRVADDRARSEGARPELHTAVKVTDDALLCYLLCEQIEQRRLVRKIMIGGADAIEEGLD